MSYSRFGWDNSDVYIFEHVGGGIECCGCPLPEDAQTQFTDLAQLEEHLGAHEAVGHTVPAGVRTGIYADRRAGEYAGWDRTDPDAPTVHAWAQPADPHAGEPMATFLERNLHMLGPDGPAIVEQLGEDRP